MPPPSYRDARRVQYTRDANGNIYSPAVRVKHTNFCPYRIYMLSDRLRTPLAHITMWGSVLEYCPWPNYIFLSRRLAP